MMMNVVLFDENNPILEWFSNSRSKSRPILNKYDDDEDWDAPGSFLIEELQMSKSDVATFKRNLGLGKNSRGKKLMSQLDEEEEFEDDYESGSPHGSPLYDEPWDICSDDEGNNSGGFDWLKDKSGGDVGKNKSDCTKAEIVVVEGVPLVPVRLLLLGQRPVFHNRPIFVQDQLEKGSQHTRVFMIYKRMWKRNGHRNMAHFWTA
ncbi:hypothetical protein ZEAMMB73_Zm00001d003995 [Zea mays]|uniref:Uncharacterized protein n=1 Tax=Zea mays TaxID=4577 RepID=A0A1D6ECU1_MAIZE|nr:hypothetical protein ZEAMMB73_Zm00001d003995 [Zea mays]ONM18122.1 hypothetical protein ZEAMMB73_Zm00001d003995 [Zea mays]ONM18123.1 hypothetical protein ZEAMMB73_Zm00001d003995 [Zea mays]ONM18125.1 hypothetical protein ZEAMMB73_Zm00001d003995 [Zea mays]